MKTASRCQVCNTHRFPEKYLWIWLVSAYSWTFPRYFNCKLLALVHFNLRGLCFILKCLWHFDPWFTMKHTSRWQCSAWKNTKWCKMSVYESHWKGSMNQSRLKWFKNVQKDSRWFNFQMKFANIENAYFIMFRWFLHFEIRPNPLPWPRNGKNGTSCSHSAQTWPDRKSVV